MGTVAGIGRESSNQSARPSHTVTTDGLRRSQALRVKPIVPRILGIHENLVAINVVVWSQDVVGRVIVEQVAGGSCRQSQMVARLFVPMLIT